MYATLGEKFFFSTLDSSRLAYKAKERAFCIRSESLVYRRILTLRIILGCTISAPCACVKFGGRFSPAKLSRTRIVKGYSSETCTAEEDKASIINESGRRSRWKVSRKRFIVEVDKSFNALPSRGFRANFLTVQIGPPIASGHN